MTKEGPIITSISVPRGHTVQHRRVASSGGCRHPEEVPGARMQVTQAQVASVSRDAGVQGGPRRATHLIATLHLQEIRGGELLKEERRICSTLVYSFYNV